MSAYINLGMICPRRMARDAQAAGAVKFLSEFLGFRESSHLWCLLHPGGYAVASVAVPAWARAQLRASSTATDAQSPTLAALEGGHTGDASWDDCQRCLAISGELHNNVRMAWGKAIPQWHGAVLIAAAESAVTSAAAAAAPATAVAATAEGAPATAAIIDAPSPATRLQAALDLLVHLNDKFALDGGAAPSYGGLLWCLGWRDRPGSNGAPSRRPTSVIAKRVPAGALERRARLRVEVPMSMSMPGPMPVPASEIERGAPTRAPASGDLSQTCGVDATASVGATPATAAASSQRWSVEYAKSNRSTCKGCGEKIEKHALRIGDAAGLLSGQYVQWRHLGCQKRDPSSLAHRSDLGGFDVLSEADKGLLVAWLDKECSEDEVGGETDKVAPGFGPGSGQLPGPPPAKHAASGKAPRSGTAPVAKRARIDGPPKAAADDSAIQMAHFLSRNSATVLAPPSAVVASTTAASTSASATAADAPTWAPHVAAPQSTPPTRRMPGTCPTCGMDLSERGPLRTERHLRKCTAVDRA